MLMFPIHFDCDIKFLTAFYCRYQSKTEIGTGREFSPEDLVERVCQKLEELIGKDFYDNLAERIIFAIAVHTTECWLLPLYYRDHNKSKIQGCLGTLNRALSKKEGFTISAKNPEYYDSISKKYLKRKTLMSKYQDNPSLKIFIEEIDKRGIVIED